MRYIIILSMLLLSTYLTYNITRDIQDDSCGVEVSSNLIHQNPWLVLLEYYRRGRKTEIRCGATLISSKYIITAAHCVKKTKSTSLVARLGEYDTSTDTDCLEDVCADPVVLINVVEIIPHPNYNDNGHDIALLKLEHEAPYTDFIRPACLPSGVLDPNVIFAASGFGEIVNLGYYSNTKKIIPLPNWSIEDCQTAYADFKLPEKIICAGGEEGIDTCRGDSGGPLTWIKNRVELWGVTSAGNTHCGKKGSPGFYTRVIDYLDWIHSVINT